MNSPAYDIAALLATNNLGAVGTSIFRTRMPDSPDELIFVSSTVSGAPEISTGSAGSRFNNIDKPHVQVLIRANVNKNSTGYATAVSVKNLLHGIAPFTLNGSRYISILAISDIAELGVDAKLRPVFSINFRIERS